MRIEGSYAQAKAHAGISSRMQLSINLLYVTVPNIWTIPEVLQSEVRQG